MFDEIHTSHPPWTGARPELASFLEGLPADYRGFLEEHNGGFVPEFRYTFLTGVPFKTEQVDNPSRNDCPVEFFGIGPGDVPPATPRDLIQTIADYEAEEFLPRNVVPVACCVQSSLVCLSLRPDDLGTVYYWDWYWQYPWCESFFLERIERAREKFGPAEGGLDDPAHPRYWELYDALNFATLVKLAPSFSAWHAMCEDHREEAGQ